VNCDSVDDEDLSVVSADYDGEGPGVETVGRKAKTGDLCVAAHQCGGAPDGAGSGQG